MSTRSKVRTYKAFARVVKTNAIENRAETAGTLLRLKKVRTHIYCLLHTYLRTEKEKTI